MDGVLTFLYNYSEYIGGIVVVGGVGIISFVKLAKRGKKHKNNLTHMVIKHNKQREVINKQSKATL